ncbi:MAG: glycosyltransferase family 39 protein [Acetobacteraceae bacterium]|nr:glycosyltransferase family 39 protein [Acetobacteraceae bacterium]
MKAVPRGARAWWPYLLVAALAVALRLYRLDDVPLWTDEMFTRFYPQAGLGYLWSEGLRTEPTSPLYYTLIWVVERVVGSESWALRGLSVAGSLAGVGLAGLLGWELFGRTAPALLAALLLALAPIDVFYAQEARAYALQGAALGLALLGFARVLRGASGLALYAAGAILAIWLHPTSVAAVAAFNGAALASAWGPGRLLDRPAMLRWFGANVLVAAACAILVPSMIAPNAGAATSWVPALTRWSLESVIGQTLAGPALASSAQRVAEGAVLAFAALALLPPWRPGRRAITVLVLVPGLTLALMIGVSLGKPVLLSRTLAWLLIPLAVALGGILSRRPAALGIAAVAVVAAALVLQLGRIATLKEDWRGLFARMPGLASPTLIVLAPHSPPGAVALYASGASPPVRLDDGGPPVPETVVMPRLFGTETISGAAFEQAIASGRSVWLIFRRPEYEWAHRELAGLPPPKRVVQSEPGSNPAIWAMQW